MLGTVPLVVFPRRTIVTTERFPNCIAPLGNCITRVNVAGSVRLAVHWQSTDVFWSTSVVGTTSEMPAARWVSAEKLEGPWMMRCAPGIGANLQRDPKQ